MVLALQKDSRRSFSSLLEMIILSLESVINVFNVPYVPAKLKFDSEQFAVFPQHVALSRG